MGLKVLNKAKQGGLQWKSGFQGVGNDGGGNVGSSRQLSSGVPPSGEPKP